MCAPPPAPLSAPTPLHVQKAKVEFGKQYLVNLLFGGTPDRFWLKLAESSTSGIEEELNKIYANRSCLSALPPVGMFVVCLHSEKFCRGKVVSYGHQESIPLE